MLIRQLFDQASSAFTYLLLDTATREAALIDPVQEQLERDLGALRELKATLRYALETHVHADHVTSAAELSRLTGAVTAASELGAPCAQRRLKHGDTLPLGSHLIRTLSTPGHTSDSLSFHVERHLFTGDALFVHGNGRTDFQNGDAGALYDSVTTKLFTLPDNTLVWPGHDYGGRPHAVSTIADERLHNPRLAGKTRAEFVAIMRDLKLAPPRLLQTAVRRNLACGDAGVGSEP